jgi:hypothetical protein
MNFVALGSQLARVTGTVPAVFTLTAAIAIGLAPMSVSASGRSLDEFAGMPNPVAMDAPDGTTRLEAAATYALGETTIRLRESQRLYRFSSTTSAITNERRVDFGLGEVYSSPGVVTKFGDRNYLAIASGEYAGWWVAAPQSFASTVTRFASPRALRLSARDYMGVRFYSDANVRTRLAVTLDAAATYHADRKGRFAGRDFYFMKDGPLAGRWVNARAVTVATRDTDSNVEPSQPVASWRGIVLLYTETDVTYRRSDGSTYRLRATMSSSMKNLVLDTLNRFHNSVRNWSGGLVTLDLDVVHVPHPVTELDALGSSYWVGPSSVREDIDTYAPTGKYDSIFVIWQAKDSSGAMVPVGGWGLTLPPGSWANGAGYTSVITPTWEWWWTDSVAPEEVFIHEWMHQVIFFQESQGRPGIDLHAASRYGYEPVNNTWKRWLSDVMQGKVWDGQKYIGISAEMWAAGSPRNP